jgi:hypothetical protein
MSAQQPWALLAFLFVLVVLVAAPEAAWQAFTLFPAMVCELVYDEEFCPLVTPHPLLEPY